MESTLQERHKVARDECRLHGHGFAHQMVVSSMVPVGIFCDRCGASWRLHPEDAAKPFGREAS